MIRMMVHGTGHRVLRGDGRFGKLPACSTKRRATLATEVPTGSTSRNAFSVFNHYLKGDDALSGWKEGYLY